MLEGYNLFFSINTDHCSLGVENDKYKACLQIKYGEPESEKNNQIRKLKPYRRKRKINK